MRKGITFRGKHSAQDFGLILKAESRKIGIPRKKKTKVSVPFQHGSYDFSDIYGSQAYEERPIQYTFFLKERNHEKSEARQTEILDWLLNSPKEKLIDDYILGYYFMAECESATFNDLEFLSELIVNFVAYPFKLAQYEEGADVWDTFNFLTDYAQETKFTVSGESNITLFNNSAIQIVPKIISDAPFELIKGNVVYNIQPGETKYWKFYLDTGENNIVLKGNGTIQFIYKREVI